MAVIRLEGRERFPLPREQLAATLANAAALAACFADVTLVEATADLAKLEVSSDVTMLPGRVRVELSVVSREANRARYRILNQARGASATVEADIIFEDTGADESHAVWTAEIGQVTGLLRMMPSIVLKAGVESAIPHIWKRIHEALA